MFPWLRREQRIVYSIAPKAITLLSFVLVLLVTGIVYMTGGTNNAYAHLYYLAILVGSLNGSLTGMLVGLVSGLLAGPLMPKDVSLDIPQTFLNWSFPLVFFVLTGAVAGWLLGLVKRQAPDLRWGLQLVAEGNLEMVEAFIKAIDGKDPYTADHSKKVAVLSVNIARKMGLTLSVTFF